ncbi:MAG: hypothetical protein A2V98_21695 [Planctomycetes bacterium RBG_16_64_12]|nr:MAG: hypothetical protein A2V98_21695 [Planctomycetes bacterium RBG_16_64_12]
MGRVLSQRFDRIQAVWGQRDLIAGGVEYSGHDPHHGRVVVNHEDPSEFRCCVIGKRVCGHFRVFHRRIRTSASRFFLQRFSASC